MKNKKSLKLFTALFVLVGLVVYTQVAVAQDPLNPSTQFVPIDGSECFLFTFDPVTREVIEDEVYVCPRDLSGACLASGCRAVEWFDTYLCTAITQESGGIISITGWRCLSAFTPELIYSNAICGVRRSWCR